MTAADTAAAKPNDRIRGRIAQVLDAGDAADVTIGYLTSYRDADRIAVQNVDHGYTPAHATALCQALGFDRVSVVSTGSDEQRWILADPRRDFTVEVYVEVPR